MPGDFGQSPRSWIDPRGFRHWLLRSTRGSNWNCSSLSTWHKRMGYSGELKLITWPGCWITSQLCPIDLTTVFFTVTQVWPAPQRVPFHHYISAGWGVMHIAFWSVIACVQIIGLLDSWISTKYIEISFTTYTEIHSPTLYREALFLIQSVHPWPPFLVVFHYSCGW